MVAFVCNLNEVKSLQVVTYCTDCSPLYTSSDVSVFVLRANINVWTSFLKLLNRHDQFIVHQVCKIMLLVA